MESVSSLVELVDAEFSAAETRVNQIRAQQVQEYQDRKKRLEQFERTLDELRTVWEPRLDALAKKFGDHVDIHPTTEPGRRSATFEFRSDLASITLRLSVSPDPEVRKIVFTYGVGIVPAFMKFNSHEELEMSLDEVNKSKLGDWLDERILDFVRTYSALRENHYYLQDHLVEDPVAKVKFPKFAAAASLEVNGKSLYFIDESMLREYKERNGTPQNSA